MLRFDDAELPEGILYHILKNVPEEKKQIILSSTVIQRESRKEGFIVTKGWASWRLKKSLQYVPNGWFAEKQWNTYNGALRIKFKRV